MASADDEVLVQSGGNGHQPGKSRAAGEKAQPAAARATPGKHGERASRSEHGDLAEDAAELAGAADALIGPSPFVGLGLRDAVGGLQSLGAVVAREPRVLLRGLPRTAGELVRIGLGKVAAGTREDRQAIPRSRLARESPPPLGTCRSTCTSGQRLTALSTTSNSTVLVPSGRASRSAWCGRR